MPIALMGLAAFGRRFLKWAGDDASRQMLVVLLIVTAQGAHAIRLEGIVGAFLAGLAVNAAMQESHAREQLEVLGNTLFVPSFFVSLGALLNLRELARILHENLGLVVSWSRCAAVIASKLLVAAIVGPSTATPARRHFRCGP